MCVGFDVLVPRQWATIVSTQTSGTMILGSRQGLPRLEPVVSDICDSHMEPGGERRNRNPWRSSGSNLVYECSIEALDQVGSRHPTFTSVLSDTVAEV